MMTYECKCEKCDKTLDFLKEPIKILKDVDGQKMGTYCLSCHTSELKKMEEFRKVETYLENDIYVKNDLYYIYWECRYFFYNLEDAKRRIHDAVVNRTGLYF